MCSSRPGFFQSQNLHYFWIDFHATYASPPLRPALNKWCSTLTQGRGDDFVWPDQKFSLSLWKSKTLQGLNSTCSSRSASKHRERSPRGVRDARVLRILFDQFEKIFLYNNWIKVSKFTKNELKSYKNILKRKNMFTTYSWLKNIKNGENLTYFEVQTY